jgi:HEAT repeat protein
MLRSIPRAWLVAVFVLFAGASADASSRPSYDDLVANLKSPNAETRREAAAALARSRRREAVPHLAALVRDPDTRVRREVVRALRELRDLSAVPALLTSLKDAEREVRLDAVGALVDAYTEPPPTGPLVRLLQPFSDDYTAEIASPYQQVDPAVHEALAVLLRDPEPQVRARAAQALGLLAGTPATDALVAALQDTDPDVRGAAATALGRVGAPQAGRALIPILADESAEVRNRVLHAIAVRRVKEAGPALRQMFEVNRRKDVALRVLSTLSRIADPAQADLFRELLQDPEPERRRLAVEGLGRISDASQLVAFKKDYQRAGNDELRLAYSFALTLLGDRAFVDTIVLNLASRTLGGRSRGYLLEMGPTVLPDLYPYLSDPDDAVRAALVDVIAAIGDGEAIPRLAPLVNDPSQNVADRANRAIERLRRVAAARREPVAGQ